LDCTKIDPWHFPLPGSLQVASACRVIRAVLGMGPARIETKPLFFPQELRQLTAVADDDGRAVALIAVMPNSLLFPARCDELADLVTCRASLLHPYARGHVCAP